MEAAQPICIAFSNADVSKSEVFISSNAIGVTGGNEGIITIPRFAGDWGVYRIVFFDKGLSVNAIVWFWVNSKTLSKAIHQQQSSNVESLIDKLISDIKEKKDGIFNICGNWKNHASGYSAIVQKIVYDTLSIRISGIIFSFDGNLWIFTSDVKDNGITTKKILFTMP